MVTSKAKPSTMTRPKQVIGGIIARRRREAGISQSELASRVGCAQSLISKLEAGKARLDLEYLIYIAWALEIPLPELFTTNPDTTQWQKAQTLVYTMATGRSPREAFPSGQPATRSTDQLAAPELLIKVGQLRDDARVADAAQRLAQDLPSVMQTVHVPGALESLSEILQVTATCLVHLGELPGAWLAAQGGVFMAEHSARSGLGARLTAACIHRRSGRNDIAAALAAGVIDSVGPELRRGTLEVVIPHGVALMELGAHAAIRHDTTDADSYLSRARRSADRLGHDIQLEGVRFGPFEVALRELDASIRLHDKRRSLRLAQAIDIREQPLLHQTRGLVHIARAYLRAGERDQACDAIVGAIRLGPQLSGDPIIRILIDELFREFTTFGEKIHQLRAHVGDKVPKPRAKADQDRH